MSQGARGSAGAKGKYKCSLSQYYSNSKCKNHKIVTKYCSASLRMFYEIGKSSVGSGDREKHSVVVPKKQAGHGERRRSSAGAEGKGSFGAATRRKSAAMSKESKLKQKKADEAALRKNKVIVAWHLI